MDADGLRRRFLNQGIAWGEGEDSEGRPYDWVIDSKAVLLDPEGLKGARDLLWEKIKQYGPEMVGGSTLASHLMTSAMVEKGQVGGFLVRKERKGHGMCKLIEGGSLQGKRVAVLDDGLNAAGFARRAIEAVEAEGGEVLAVAVLIDFEREDHDELEKLGIPVERVMTLEELGLETQEPEDLDLYSLEWRYCPVNLSDYSAPKSSPIVDEDKIYVCSDQGRIRCLDFSGKVLWEYDIAPCEHGIHATPVIVENMLIIGGYDGRLYALDKESGEEVWVRKHCSYIGSSPIFDEETGLLFIGLENSTRQGTIAAIDAKTGDLRWELQTRNHVASRAATFANTVIQGSNDGRIYCAEKNTGRLCWNFRTGGEVKGRLTIDDKRLYATSFDGHLYCLDAACGELLWKRKLGRTLYNAPLVVMESVLVGSPSGAIVFLDKRTGAVEWLFKTKGPVMGYPSIHDGLVCVGSDDGCAYLLDLERRKLVWRFITPGKVTSCPVFHEDRLLVSGTDGYLYCFRKRK